MKRIYKWKVLTISNILLLTLIVSLFNAVNYLGCGVKQIRTEQDSIKAETSPTDSVNKNQIVTRLYGNMLKKTMDYPYLIVKFHQNDTEVELALDPQTTNLTLDLVRKPDDYLQVQKGDSVLIQEADSSSSENLISEKNNRKNNKIPDDLTDEIIRDINLAQKLFYQKQYDEALKILQASLQKKKTATAYALGGSIYFVNGDIEEAVNAWENALKINPNLEEVRQLIMRYKN